MDDLNLIFSDAFQRPIEKLEELLTQPRKVFLLGAGCSKCAGFPLMSELTEKALVSDLLAVSTKDILIEIKKSFEGAKNANIEDYLSELVDLISIAERRSSRGSSSKRVALNSHHYSCSDLLKAAEEIKATISESIDKEAIFEHHQKFIRAIHNPIRPGINKGFSPVDYLILNYDTLIENALSIEKVAYSDGIEGGSVGWWKPSNFRLSQIDARVIKLHGSIDWIVFPDEDFPRRVPRHLKLHRDAEKEIMIWPASTKYLETQRDPYSQLANIARDSMRSRNNEQKVFFICGYSFGDSHINADIELAIKDSKKSLTLVVFYSEDELEGVLKDWNQNPDIREQVVVYANRGFWHGETVIRSDVDLPWWKFEALARLFGGER